MIIALQVIEFIVLLAITVKLYVKAVRLSRRFVKPKQPQFLNYGMTAGLVGIIITSALSQVTRDMSNVTLLVECIIILIGFGFIIVGAHMMLAAYQSEEEAPRWIKWIGRRGKH